MGDMGNAGRSSDVETLKQTERVDKSREEPRLTEGENEFNS